MDQRGDAGQGAPVRVVHHRRAGYPVGVYPQCGGVARQRQRPGRSKPQ
jgi:hypothetical protein